MITNYKDRLQRPAWYKWYSSSRWLKMRAKHLAANPICVMCAQSNLKTLATVCDHKVSPKGNEAMFFDESNVQSLCVDHHNSSKQQVEKRGYLKDIDASGWPIDVNHPANVAERRMQQYQKKYGST